MQLGSVLIYLSLSIGLLVGTNYLMDYLVISVVGKEVVTEALSTQLNYLYKAGVVELETAYAVVDRWNGIDHPIGIMGWILSKMLRVTSLMQASGSVEGAGKWVGLSSILIITAAVLLIRSTILIAPWKKQQDQLNSAIGGHLKRQTPKIDPKKALPGMRDPKRKY